MPSSRRSSQPRNWTLVSYVSTSPALADGFFTTGISYCKWYEIEVQLYSFFFFLVWDIKQSQHHLLERLFIISSGIILTPLLKIDWLLMWRFISGFLVSIDLFVCSYVSTSLSWLLRLVVNFEIGSMSPLTLIFFFKVVLTVQGPLHFLMNFRIYLSISAKKKCNWDFSRGSFESVDQFGKYYHLNIIK